jgi:hypothetical protein
VFVKTPSLSFHMHTNAYVFIHTYHTMDIQTHELFPGVSRLALKLVCAPKDICFFLIWTLSLCDQPTQGKEGTQENRDPSEGAPLSLKCEQSPIQNCMSGA